MVMTALSERRRTPRLGTHFLFNKHVAGYPYLCEALDLSKSGLRARCLGGPAGGPASFTLELRLPGDPKTLWIWARCVRQQGREQGLEFVGLGAEEQARIGRYVLGRERGLRSTHPPATGLLEAAWERQEHSL